TGPSFFSHQIPNLGPGSDAESRYGVESTAPMTKLTADLESAVNSTKTALYTLNPNPRPADDRPDAKAIRSLKERLPDAKFQNVAPALADLRKIKSAGELALLQKAIDITGDAQERVMARIGPDLFEYQLEARVIDAFLDGGAMRAGFASIIGSGPNGVIP